MTGTSRPHGCAIHGDDYPATGRLVESGGAADGFLRGVMVGIPIPLIPVEAFVVDLVHFALLPAGVFTG
jgi:hypothetical protein